MEMAKMYTEAQATMKWYMDAMGFWRVLKLFREYEESHAEPQGDNVKAWKLYYGRFFNELKTKLFAR